MAQTNDFSDNFFRLIHNSGKKPIELSENSHEIIHEKNF